MKKTILYCLFAIFLLACSNSKPNVSNIIVDATIHRFDKDLFSTDINHLDVDLKSLSQKYGKYWLMYNKGVLRTGDPSAFDFDDYIEKFICDKNIREVYDTCSIVFADVKKQEKELEMAFKYMKYYFPKAEVPKVYFHVSGFNQSIVVDSAIISVSIDNYLGENCKFYDMLAMPIAKYLRSGMTKDRIPLDVLKAKALTSFSFSTKKDNLLSKILYNGKILYFLSKVFPDREESFIINYTKKQYDWCANNEAACWGFFIEKDYLYSSDHFIISKYTNDSPFTSGMPGASPGRVANWIGLQIIKSYMNNNKCSLSELMLEFDYDAILRESNYQPE
ncbi:MAG: hypothetical protein WBG43_12175 [Marinifilaceae bacterium]